MTIDAPDGLADAMAGYTDWSATGLAEAEDPYLFGPLRDLLVVFHRATETEAPATQSSRRRRIDRWSIREWVEGDAVVDVEGEYGIAVVAGGQHLGGSVDGWTMRWHHDAQRGWMVVDTCSRADSHWRSEVACPHPGQSWSDPRGWTVQPLWRVRVARGWRLLASLTNSSDKPVQFADIVGRWHRLEPGREVVLSSLPQPQPNGPVVFGVASQGMLRRARQATITVELPPGHPRQGWCGP